MMIIKRIKSLLNSQTKSAVFLVIIFFGFLAFSELDVLFWKIPNYDQLTIKEGKIKIIDTLFRTGIVHNLYINGEKIPFDCGIPNIQRIDCLSPNNLKDIKGKMGKVWWNKCKEKNCKYSQIYQLEVNKIILINYFLQKEKYLSYKKNYFYPYTIFFVLSLVLFCFVQFSNYSSK